MPNQLTTPFRMAVKLAAGGGGPVVRMWNLSGAIVLGRFLKPYFIFLNFRSQTVHTFVVANWSSDRGEKACVLKDTVIVTVQCGVVIC